MADFEVDIKEQLGGEEPSSDLTHDLLSFTLNLAHFRHRPSLGFGTFHSRTHEDYSIRSCNITVKRDLHGHS